VEYGNALKLASMFKEMLSDEDLLREMGLKGRDFVFRNFNWNNIVGMIEEVYEDAIKRSSH